MGGWVGGWLENEFLKKTPSPKFGLESQLGTSDLEFVNIRTIVAIEKNEQSRTA